MGESQPTYDLKINLENFCEINLILKKMDRNKLYLLVLSLLVMFHNLDAQVSILKDVSCVCEKIAIQNTEYEGKTIENIDFRNINLTGYSFKGSTLKGCIFDGMKLTEVNFKGAAIDANNSGNRTSFSGATFKEVCFQDAYINEVDFQYCTFEKVDFQHASIYDVYWGTDIQFIGDTSSRSSFAYSTLKVNKPWLFPLDKLKQEYWSLIDFSFTIFFGLSTENFHLTNKDFSDAILRGIQLENFDVSSAIFRRADLSEANFNYSTLSKTVFENAILRKTTFIHSTGANAKFGHAILYHANFSKGSFPKADFTNTKLGGARIINSEMRGANFKKAQFIGDKLKLIPQTIISNTNFSNATFYDAAINEVDFSGSQLNKAKFSEGSGTTISKTNFSNSIMEEVNFQNATLEGVNFTGAILTNAIFKGSTLRASSAGIPVSFKCALLAGADLSGNLQAVNFLNAIVPINQKGCCKVKGADEITCGSSYLGTIAKLTQLSKSKSGSVTCPDGSSGPCSMKNWTNYSPQYCKNIWTEDQIWNRPNCDSLLPPSDNVHFTDPNLEKAIKKYLGLSSETPITKILAKTVRSLDCSGSQIKTTGGLEAFTALEKLNLSHNEIKEGDFSYLSEKLNHLKVEHNLLIALKLSSNQIQLKVLDASNNNISSITGFTGKYFISIDLSHNQLDQSLKVYLKSDQLIFADLSNNKIKSSGNDLKKLRDIQRLHLQNNQLTKIGNLEKLTKLKSLDLTGNNRFDCQSLRPYPSPGPIVICP